MNNAIDGEKLGAFKEFDYISVGKKKASFQFICEIFL